MRVYTRIVAILFILACTAVPLCAQMLPRNTAVDSSFRIEYLIGRQTLGREFTSSDQGHYLDDFHQVPQHPDPIDRLNIQYGASLPILEGVIEVSPFQSVSGRLVGSMSVLESIKGFTLVSGPASAQFQDTSFGSGLFFYSCLLYTSPSPRAS